MRSSEVVVKPKDFHLIFESLAYHSGDTEDMIEIRPLLEALRTAPPVAR